MGIKRLSRRRMAAIEARGIKKGIGCSPAMGGTIISATQHREGLKVTTDILYDLGASGTSILTKGLAAADPIGISGTDVSYICKLTAAVFGSITTIETVCLEVITDGTLTDYDLMYGDADGYLGSDASNDSLLANEASEDIGSAVGVHRISTFDAAADIADKYLYITAGAATSQKASAVIDCTNATPSNIADGIDTIRLIDSHTHSEMERTGHGECNFPLLIPEDLLEKENRLVSLLKRARESGVNPDELRGEEEEAGFKKEVYWVKHAGENELDIPMFLRPTSETAMYTMFPLWIRSHADLPLKIYQTVNTFRYETKQTRSFIRVREIHFFEAHTAHIDEESATKQIEEDLEIVSRLMNSFALPVIVSKRPIWDTFPGAWYTIAIDVVMPNGRTLQVASVHHYRDQWAKAFDITYENIEGSQSFVHQTTYGMSERLLGAIVGMHGDDAGLILPPSVSPYQIVLVPIISKDNSEKINNAVIAINERLKKSGYRTHIDNRNIRPGQKYFDWEIKGVPIRLDFGARDMESNTIMCSSRIGGKISINLDNLENDIDEIIKEIHQKMVENANIRLDEAIQKLPDLIFDNKEWKLSKDLEEDKIYWTIFDGNDSDAETIEKLTGLSFLGDALDKSSEELECCITKKKTFRKVFLAKTY